MVPLEKEADGFGLERMMDDKKLSDLFVQAQSEIKRLTTQRNISQLPK
jgi:hypothetical protein